MHPDDAEGVTNKPAIRSSPRVSQRIS